MRPRIEAARMPLVEPDGDESWQRWLFEESLDGILLTSPEGGVLYGNPAICRMLGYTQEEIRTLGRARIVDPADPRLGPALEQRRKTGAFVGELTFLARDGRRVPVEITSRLFEDRTGRQLTSMFVRDITERARSQDSLRRSEQHQRLLAEAGEALASSLDYERTLAHVVRLAVPRFADISIADLYRDHGVDEVALADHDPEREALVRVMRERFPPSSLPESHPVRRVRRTGRAMLLPDVSPGYVEGTTTRDEHRRMVDRLGLRSAMFVPLQARDRAIGVLSFYSTTRQFDQGDLALAEELGRRAGLAIDNARLYDTARRATKARDDVLGVVSHDLRNPLSTILMCAGALLDPAPAPPEGVRSMGEIIHQSADWALRIIRDLLDVTNLEGGGLVLHRGPVAVGDVLARVVELVWMRAADSRISLRTEVADGLPPADADYDRLMQVLINLVDNAIKFTRPGGEIVLGARTDLVRGESRVRVTVSDSGIGIAPEHLSRVFDRFWQVRRTGRAGAGLGLAIAKGIVESHGGEIGVSSVVGEGTRFWFTVPVASDDGAPATTSEGAGTDL